MADAMQAARGIELLIRLGWRHLYSLELVEGPAGCFIQARFMPAAPRGKDGYWVSASSTRL